MRDILLIAGVFLCALIAIKKPVFGILTFVCVGLLNPQSLTWGMGRTFRIAQLIAIGTLIGFFVSAESRQFPKQRELFLMLAVWVTFGITTIYALQPEAALEQLVYTSKILLMVVVSTALINTEARLLQLIRVIALSLGFHAFKAGAFSIASGGNFMVWGPEGSFLEANNAIGLALAMNVPILFHLSRIETDKRFRWLERAMFFLSYPAVICTFSRGAWLSLVAVTALIIWKSRHRMLVVAAVVILAPLSIPFMPERVNQRYGELENFEEEGSAQSRFWNWEFCRRVGFASPLVGGGFNYYSMDAYARFFPEFLQRWPGKVWSCHSMWFTVLGEHGLPGFCIWVILLTSSLLSLRKIKRYAASHSGAAFFVELHGMLLGAFAGYIVAGTFLDVAYFDLFYQLVAVVVIAKELILASEAKSSATASSIVVNTTEALAR